MGYGLQCNGSRINAIQSEMMGHSEKIYLVELGKQALSNQIVCIWDYADIDFFPDTKMQLEFADNPYEYWETETMTGKGVLSMKHAAVACGIGQIGKSSLLLNPKYGNRLTLVHRFLNNWTKYSEYFFQSAIQKT
uniref:hypothetical protein n=1 Tax=Acetatifactor sp. TaxID=1872090 RepID=UPI004056735D